MDHKAALLALVLVSSSLAGCTGDPDAGGGDEFDAEALQDLIDENLQDFLNNTTITVNNHYYNNTTVVNNNYNTNNEFNNTTNVDGGEINNYFEEYDYSQDNYSFGGGAGGNGTGGVLYLLDIQFNLNDLMPDWAEIDHRNNTIDYLHSYYDYLTNSYRNDSFTIQCSDYYLVGSQSFNGTFEVSYWEDSSNYWDAWVDQYNQTIANMLQGAAYANYGNNSSGETDYHVRVACDEDFSPGYGFSDLLLFEIPIPAGVALSGIFENYLGIEEYVWWYESHTTTQDSNSGDYIHTGSGDMIWRTTYYPRVETYWDTNAFGVDFEFETISWSYRYDGWVGGDEESALIVSVDNIRPGYEYRLIAYFVMSSVVPLE